MEKEAKSIPYEELKRTFGKLFFMTIYREYTPDEIREYKDYLNKIRKRNQFINKDTKGGQSDLGWKNKKARIYHPPGESRVGQNNVFTAYW